MDETSAVFHAAEVGRATRKCGHGRSATGVAISMGEIEVATFTVLYCVALWLLLLIVGEMCRKEAPPRPPPAPPKASVLPPADPGPLGALLLGFLVLAVIARVTAPSEERRPCPK